MAVQVIAVMAVVVVTVLVVLIAAAVMAVTQVVARVNSSVKDRGPRLADPAFRAQRDAVEHAQEALRKLAAQAHGEALTQLLGAWQARDAEQLPSAQQLGGKVTAPVRTSWSAAVVTLLLPKGNAAEALLRLEMAADVHTPADQLNARRALQLQMLTRRNEASPQQTWGQDIGNGAV